MRVKMLIPKLIVFVQHAVQSCFCKIGIINFVWCRQGVKGDEIIEALIANSATYEKKTAFSQVSLMME